jgi:hypothetical protein
MARLSLRMLVNPSVLRLARVPLALAVALVALRAAAADFRFSSGLSQDQRTESGVSKLTANQVAELDRLVAADVASAHEGGVTGFSSTFTARRSPQERADTGIGALTETERRTLDVLAARAIAMGPPPEQMFSYSPPKAEVPKAPPPKAEAVGLDTPRLEVHGDLSFTVGGSLHGRGFYGTSDDIAVVDAKDGFSLDVGFDDFKGKGLLGLYGPFGLYGPNGPYGPNYGGPPYFGW